MPAPMKADRQPQAEATQGTTAGATIAPTLVPALNRLVAKARSRFGNHSATALIAAGKLPPSPSPRAMRARKNPRTLPTRACPRAAILQAKMDTAYPTLLPNLSTNQPKNSRLTA
jgi:hypothetical protein